MFINAKKITGYPVEASDGRIGDVTSLFLDCVSFRIRYLAVETGRFLNRHQVLIPASSVPLQDFADKKVHVNLNREQVRNSPDVNLATPVSRGAENEVVRYYSSPRYWDMEQPGQGGITHIPSQGRMVVLSGREMAEGRRGEEAEARRIPDAQYLFSSRDLLKYDTRALDGKLGDIDDLIIDTNTWDIRYLAVDTGTIMAGKRALVPPQKIDSINDEDNEVTLDLTKDAVRNSPDYDPRRPIDMDLQRRLSEHYNLGAYRPLFALWRFNAMRHGMPRNRKLRIETRAPAVVKWSHDEWKTFKEVKTAEIEKGIHVVDLDTENIQPGTSVHFTFFWPQADHWEGKNYSVKVRAEERKTVPEMAGVR
jgi:uncharacterized protein YrrD